MTRTQVAKLAAATKTPGDKHVEAMLRDIAMVLHLTKKVKAEIVQDRKDRQASTMPTGGRFSSTPAPQLDLDTIEREFAMA